MQALSKTHPITDPAAFVEDLVSESLPGRRGFGPWRAFLRAHASLMRELATDLIAKTGLSLGEFDVLVQLALAGGELRMSELAARAYSSRSGMTRRIDHLVDLGLVGRTNTDADARGVMVGLTDAGLQRLGEIVPVHMGAVAKLFVEPLEDEELEVLERALEKVALDCSFG
jgi:DNA-binding MarR family transcriptional regulator